MSRPTNDKCRQCANLDAETAQKIHGLEGDGCWAGQVCHVRRSHYRNRGKRLKKRSTIHQISSPSGNYAVIYLWRRTKDEPLHAVSAELWIDGEKVAVIQPVHALGTTNQHVSSAFTEIQELFKQHLVAKGLNPNELKFDDVVELDPQTCPISPCPLRPAF